MTTTVLSSMMKCVTLISRIIYSSLYHHKYLIRCDIEQGRDTYCSPPPPPLHIPGTAIALKRSINLYAMIYFIKKRNQTEMI